MELLIKRLPKLRTQYKNLPIKHKLATPDRSGYGKKWPGYMRLKDPMMMTTALLPVISERIQSF